MPMLCIIFWDRGYRNRNRTIIVTNNKLNENLHHISAG